MRSRAVQRVIYSSFLPYNMISLRPLPPEDFQANSSFMKTDYSPHRDLCLVSMRRDIKVHVRNGARATQKEIIRKTRP